MATRRRRRYTPQQQAQFVEQYLAVDPRPAMQAFAATIPVAAETFRTWVRRYERQPTASIDPMIENRRLRAQLADAEAERDSYRNRYTREHGLRLAYAATLRAFEETSHG